MPLVRSIYVLIMYVLSSAYVNRCPGNLDLTILIAARGPALLLLALWQHGLLRGEPNRLARAQSLQLDGPSHHSSLSRFRVSRTHTDKATVAGM